MVAPCTAGKGVRASRAPPIPLIYRRNSRKALHPLLPRVCAAPRKSLYRSEDQLLTAPPNGRGRPTPLCEKKPDPGALVWAPRAKTNERRRIAKPYCVDMKRPLVIVLIAILISSIIGFIDGMRVSMLPAEIHAFVLQNVTLTCDGYQNSSTCQLKFVIDRDRIADFPISSDLKAGSWQISARDQAVIDREDATAALTKFLFSSSVPALIISASAGSLATMIAKNQSVREMMASRIVVWNKEGYPKASLDRRA